MHFFLPLRRITAGGLVVRQPARQAARSLHDLNLDAILQGVTNGAVACIKADHFKVGIFDTERRICASSATPATSADLRAEMPRSCTGAPCASKTGSLQRAHLA